MSMGGDRALAGKVVVVTGAGSGVGRAVALALADAGARTVLVARSADAIGETAREIAARGGEALAVPCDVADEAAVAAMADAVSARFGGADGAVLAAGIGRFGPVETYPLADWNATLATNLTGAFLVSRALLPSMRARGGGWIVAIGSGAGKQGYANLAAYSASKFGLIGFMQALGAEVGGDGIRTAVVNPGSILTPFGGKDVADAVLWLLRQPDRAWTQEMNLWPF